MSEIREEHLGGEGCRLYSQELTEADRKALMELLSQGDNFGAAKLLYEKGLTREGKIQFAYEVGLVPREILNAINDIGHIISFSDLQEFLTQDELEKIEEDKNEGQREKIRNIELKRKDFSKAFGELLRLTVFDNLEFYIQQGDNRRKISFKRDGTLSIELLSKHDIYDDSKIYENLISVMEGKGKQTGELLLSTIPVPGEGADFAIQIIRGCVVTADDMDTACDVDPYKDWIIQLMTSLRNLFLQQKYWGQAYTDGLTRLHNRRSFDSIDFSNKGGFLAMLDMDHFKMVNDTYGHDVGDSVLMQLGRLMQESFRENDMLFRIGGEEFVVWLDCDDLEDVNKIMERFRQKVESYDFGLKDEKGNVVHKTISIGIAKNGGANSLKQADEALYKSKHNGRNMITVAE